MPLQPPTPQHLADAPRPFDVLETPEPPRRCVPGWATVLVATLVLVTIQHLIHRCSRRRRARK
jgi:hypothetical protein